MTNGLKIFLAFYILVGQPALLGWMLDSGSLYKLAWLNALVFFISCMISDLSKPDKSNVPVDNKVKLVERSEEKVSRVENDGDVSVVEVAKKQEVILQPLNNEVNDEIMNEEERKEEKSEDKLLERPLRESVSIPKIVQPLSGHQTPKKKKKEWMWGQRLVMLLTIVVAAVIAGTLWEFLGSRGIAIALFLGWILYLVIGKLFDVNGFYNVKKLFTNWLYIVLIIAGIGYGVYAMQNDNSFNILKDKAISYVKNRFTSEKKAEVEVNTGDVLYVFEGTGEVIAYSGEDENHLENTGLLENEMGDVTVEIGSEENSETDISVQPVNVVQPEIIVQPETNVQSEVGVVPEVDVVPEVNIEEQVQEPVVEDPNRQVTWGEAIKHLLQGYTLSKKTDKTFVYVAKSNELYPYFKTAQEKAMIGFDVNPNKNISCETYMSLKGILEGWKVNIYDRSQTRNIYWEKAYQLGKTNGCAKGSFVKVKNL